MRSFVRITALGCGGLLLCCAQPQRTSLAAPSTASTRPALPEERHLANLRQLTFGGENAEAYWSFAGSQLSFQARQANEGCDRIYRLDVKDPQAKPVPVSSGKGATTCAHFLKGDQALVFASTHLGGEACPPKPDMSQGYVWALHSDYDLFRVNADGSGLTRLSETPGYDAEATVCAKDGSIVFTSVRDGDLELYRMDADGKNVRRLTNTPGYDGGAFFNADCSKIVWRASRPKPGPELDAYRALLAQGLVRPSKLELYVANADGSDPVQVTYLGAAAFAPFFHPNQQRILFSSNHGDPRGREFDIWAVNVDGTGLERITYAPGFDGFPMFSPDGKWLAFSSNRATPEGQSDTNVFLARWVESPPEAATAAQTPAEQIREDVRWLAAPEREGRGVSTAGLEQAAQYLEARFKALGLEPAGDNGTYRQAFTVRTGVTRGPKTEAAMDGKPLAADQFTPLGFSSQGAAEGPLVLAGYGIRDAALGVDDYRGLNVRGKTVVVRRFVPDTEAFSEAEKKRRFGDLRYKAWVAKERGAKALWVVDWPQAPANATPDWSAPPEAKLPSLQVDSASDAGLPVLVVRRAALEPIWAKLEKGTPVGSRTRVDLRFESAEAFNVVGRLPGASSKAGEVVVGAHYDHLGFGGVNSLAPDVRAPHLGADDNASGVAVLLEVARALSTRPQRPARDVVFTAFSAEEAGVLGSTHFTRARGAKGMKPIAAMVNLDMVGRLRNNTLSVFGSESAEEWTPLVSTACEAVALRCELSGDGYGPSDHSPFYAAGTPVVHLFTGTHSDYHKPSDAPDRLNYAGAARVALLVEQVVERAAGPTQAFTYRKLPSPTPRGDLRSFNASLGSVPDYAGPPNGKKGVLLAGVRAGGAADLAGMKRGDLLVKLGRHQVGSVEDLMYVLSESKPGETVTAVVEREGKPVAVQVTFQEGRRH